MESDQPGRKLALEQLDDKSTWDSFATIGSKSIGEYVDLIVDAVDWNEADTSIQYNDLTQFVLTYIRSNDRDNRLRSAQVNLGCPAESFSEHELVDLANWLLASDLNFWLPCLIDLKINNADIGLAQLSEFVRIIQEGAKGPGVCDHLKLDLAYNNRGYRTEDDDYFGCIATLLSDRSMLPANQSLTLNLSNSSLRNDNLTQIMESVVGMYEQDGHDPLELHLILADNQIDHRAVINLFNLLEISDRLRNISLDLSNEFENGNILDKSAIAARQLVNLFSNVKQLPVGFSLDIRQCFSDETRHNEIINAILGNQTLMNQVTAYRVEIKDEIILSRLIWMDRQRLSAFGQNTKLPVGVFCDIARFLTHVETDSKATSSRDYTENNRSVCIRYALREEMKFITYVQQSSHDVAMNREGILEELKDFRDQPIQSSTIRALVNRDGSSQLGQLASSFFSRADQSHNEGRGSQKQLKM
ncbi:MAG: hypothetical protein CMF46_02960 [Legionellales bacterium]|nr:hypothetical protein [Legionellales bacterium]|tara:strand:+ start:557 stop:1975 length:1419 start_codon:yes stop_codon:yes gene_type:complete